MAEAYSSQTCRRLAAVCDEAGLLRPRRITRYEAGEVVTLDVTGVAPAWRARVTFELERYVGGGFAGQVYRARVVRIEGAEAARSVLPVGGVFALKIFVPWSRFARGFRAALYAVAFQAPFGLRVNRAAVRAAALWQKVIRRGARIRFGDEAAVVDVHATFFDPRLGSMGEVLEWVDGRVWRLEVNEHLFREDEPAGPAEGQGRGERPVGEYEAKKAFMRRFVALLHEMGAPEFARQYEWWTMKSQPNVLKRLGRDGDPAAGLVAVDFGAGLALLPFLPMSPGDFKLIVQGLLSGRPVQFDRGDMASLASFVGRHAAAFSDLGGAVAELRLAETAYRESQVDLAHHGARLMTDHRLQASVVRGWVGGYEARGIMDGRAARRFSRRPLRLGFFVLLGLVPLVGRWLQRLWGSLAYRRHLLAMLTDLDYLKRAVRARQAEHLIEWHRRGRAAAERAMALAARPVAFWLQAFTLAFLPASWHRFLTDRRFARDVFLYVAVRPFVLYFSRARREQWLRDMVEEGRAQGTLTGDEADHILSRIKEPYIQTYLMSLVVHLFTIPITQVVSFPLAAYVYAKTGSIFWSGLVLGGAQFTPISPGSIVRGLYATGLMIWKRDWHNYSWAVCISYWKYVGYLAFPVQMMHAYPILARFVAARWATHVARAIPVFGERGALLEHGLFNVFFNVPVSLRKRHLARRKRRPKLRRPDVLIGTCLGIGYLPGPTGTYASAVCAGLLLGAFYLGCPLWGVAVAAILATALGLAVGSRVEERFGKKDPGPFVLDEVAGMLVAGLAAWLPWNRWAWATLAMAFFWYRFFDIVKPPPVRQLERLPRAWGIMADDVAAAGLALALTIGGQLFLNALV